MKNGSPKKKLTPKQLILRLCRLIAKDAKKAKLPVVKEKRIIDQLGLVLEEVDAYVGARPPVCWCVYDGSGACITTSNCTLLHGTCKGPCP
jgi:hypothetical protein